MRVLLRERGSQLYYKTTGAWVPDESEAADFKTVEAAKQHLDGTKHKQVDIVLRFGEGNRCEIAA